MVVLPVGVMVSTASNAVNVNTGSTSKERKAFNDVPPLEMTVASQRFPQCLPLAYQLYLHKNKSPVSSPVPKLEKPGKLWRLRIGTANEVLEYSFTVFTS